MNKEAFKIICDLIHKQLITYDEAQVLIEALNENEKETVYVPTYPYTPGVITDGPYYNPWDVYCNNSTTAGTDSEVIKVSYNNDSKTNMQL